MPPPSRRSPSTTQDEISLLTLPEVRTRLTRNNALLSSSLFASSPSQPQPPPSPSSSNVNNNGIGPGPGPGPSQGLSQGPGQQQPSDPIREKLLIAREALLAREKELLEEQTQDEIQDQDGTDPASGGARRGSEGMRSGKRRVIESIKQGEGSLAKNGLIL